MERGAPRVSTHRDLVQATVLGAARLECRVLCLHSTKLPQKKLFPHRHLSADVYVILVFVGVVSIRQHTSAYVSIRQHTSAYVNIRQHTSAYPSIRQYTSAYVSIRQHTSAYVSIPCTMMPPARPMHVYIYIHIYIHIYICIYIYAYIYAYIYIENAAGHQIHQEATAFFEEFGTRLEGVQPRGSKSQLERMSENGSVGGFTRGKDSYRLNDIRTAACCRDMEIWVPKAGIAPAADRIEVV
jgi:hypothetical protein